MEEEEEEEEEEDGGVDMNCPASHLKQVVAPAFDVSSESHLVHDDEPYALILPATQSLQTLVLPSPSSSNKYRPASHAVQTVKPFSDVVPSRQLSHDVFLPCSVLYVSAAHGMHIVSFMFSVVVVEYLPGEQSLQPALLATPSAEEYFPARQLLHESEF